MVQLSAVIACLLTSVVKAHITSATVNDDTYTARVSHDGWLDKQPQCY